MRTVAAGGKVWSCDGSADDIQLQAAIDSISGGVIELSSGTFSFSSGATLSKKIHLVGQGFFSTILKPAASINPLTVSSTNADSDWKIQDLQIDMGTFSGHGIYSGFTGHADGDGIASINRVKITGIQAGYCGIYLVDPYYMKISQIYIKSSGTGIKLEGDYAYSVKYGNSFIDQVLIAGSANSAVGLDVTASTGDGINLLEFNRLQIDMVSSSYTGTTAIKLTDAADVTFSALDLERFSTGILMTSAARIELFNPYLYSSTASTKGIQLESTCTNVQVFGGLISTPGSGGIGWDDNSTAGEWPHHVWGTGFSSANNPDPGSNTVFHDIRRTT